MQKMLQTMNFPSTFNSIEIGSVVYGMLINNDNGMAIKSR